MRLQTSARTALTLIGTPQDAEILTVQAAETTLIVATRRDDASLGFGYTVDVFRQPTDAETDPELADWARLVPGQWVLIWQAGDHVADAVSQMVDDARRYLACSGLDVPALPEDTPAAAEPEILETVPARGQLLGYTRFAIAPGAPLPDGRTIDTVEDPHGSAWRVTDDHGRVRWLHKHGSLVRYTSGVIAFTEPEWAGWASD